MPRLSKALPKYRKHRSSGQAIVTLNGRDHYLGPHGTRASKLEYDRLVAEWLANGRSLPAPDDEKKDAFTVIELIADYVAFLEVEYANFHEAGSEPSRIRPALRLVKTLYGRTPVNQFGPRSLRAVRQRFIDADQCRSFVNDNTRRVVRMFRWGVANELVPPDILRGLQAVEGLRRGRSGVREGRKVRPVPLADVDATLPYLPPVVADVVRLQLILGCRPGELLSLKPGQIDRAEPDLWIYRPQQHKNAHHGQDRIIYLGPKAIAVLSPYMLRPAESFCFDPRESERKRNEQRHAKRETPLHHGNRPGSRRTKNRRRPPRPCYSPDSYRRAITRAAEKAGVPPWFPYQLRHTRATELREQYGIEGAQCILGHTNLDTSQIYAMKSENQARAIAKEVG